MKKTEDVLPAAAKNFNLPKTMMVIIESILSSLNTTRNINIKFSHVTQCATLTFFWTIFLAHILYTYTLSLYCEHLHIA